jgi:hypothetical protein
MNIIIKTTEFVDGSWKVYEYSCSFDLASKGLSSSTIFG